MTSDNDIDEVKLLKKQVAILNKKFERCNRERGELELLLDQTRSLLDTVGKEKISEEEQKQLSFFRKFVPQEFIHSLQKADFLNVKLGDHVENVMTVLFNDIRSFTLLSEQMSIEENFAFINNYLLYMFPAVQKNRGFIDKYIGDAIMALFTHSHDAIQAGIDMRKALIKFNELRQQESKVPINIGIGLHCGKIMLGIIGVEDRMQGTVISQIVNQASHLEQLTKKYGSAMLVTQQVISNHIDEYPTRYIGRVKVYDVSTVNYLDLFEVLSAENDPVYEMKLKSKMNFEQGVKLFYEKCFAEASVQFTLSLKSFPEDKAGKDYLKQCAALMISGVPDNWDGANPL